jgi:Recombination endonuclease VII
MTEDIVVDYLADHLKRERKRECDALRYATNQNKYRELGRSRYANNREKYRASSRRWRANNREKHRKSVDRWLADHPKKTHEYRLRDRLHSYNLTISQYEDMLRKQNGVCAICKQPNSNGRALAVDHDHSCCPTKLSSCGKCIRGLLCSNCNIGLGNLRESHVVLLAAIEYITKSVE